MNKTNLSLSISLSSSLLQILPFYTSRQSYHSGARSTSERVVINDYAIRVIILYNANAVLIHSLHVYYLIIRLYYFIILLLFVDPASSVGATTGRFAAYSGGEMACKDPSFMAKLTGLVKSQTSGNKKDNRKRSESTHRNAGSSPSHHRSSTK